MTELAFLIFSVVGLITTAKLWKPWIQSKADEMEIAIKNNSVDLQDDMHTLAKRITDTKAKHDGKWYSVETLDEMMK